MLKNELEMAFNYEPVLFREIKSHKGLPMNKQTQEYKTLIKALPNVDHNLGNVYRRLGERVRAFTDKIVWDNEILPTLTARCNIMRGEDLEKISNEDKIHAQTFPEDYDFLNCDVGYVCGMSVPPIMIKRVVKKLIEQGVYDVKE